MNRIPAQIDAVKTHEGVSLVTFTALDDKITMIALELPQGVEPGKKATLGIKATHIAIAKERSSHLAIANQIPVTVETIERGEILASLKLRHGTNLLESILPITALSKLDLSIGDDIYALFQASETAILEMANG